MAADKAVEMLADIKHFCYFVVFCVCFVLR